MCEEKKVTDGEVMDEVLKFYQGQTHKECMEDNMNENQQDQKENTERDFSLIDLCETYKGGVLKAWDIINQYHANLLYRKKKIDFTLENDVEEQENALRVAIDTAKQQLMEDIFSELCGFKDDLNEDVMKRVLCGKKCVGLY